MRGWIAGAVVAGLALVALGIAASRGPAPLPEEPDPPSDGEAPGPRAPERERPIPRVLQPDAERAGQVAGQLAELRFRIDRSGGTCAVADLEDAAQAFADARTDADDADWRALADRLDAIVAEAAGCPAPGVDGVVARLREWRRRPPFPP